MTVSRVVIGTVVSAGNMPRINGCAPRQPSPEVEVAPLDCAIGPIHPRQLAFASLSRKTSVLLNPPRDRDATPRSRMLRAELAELKNWLLLRVIGLVVLQLGAFWAISRLAS